MKPKPYKAKSLSGAERKVRELRKIIDQYDEVLGKREDERILLAKLAATGPAFNNPLEAMAAEQVRDEILKSLRMNPDGTFIKSASELSQAKET